MDYLPLWFLYSIVVMNILLVINASSNFLIYLFAGNSFRDQVKFLTINDIIILHFR